MKLEKFKVEVAVRDDMKREDLIKNVETMVAGVNGVLCSEVSVFGSEEIVRPLSILVIEKPSASSRPKRKYTRHAKPSAPRQEPKINVNGERETKHVNSEGDVVTTRR